MLEDEIKQWIHSIDIIPAGVSEHPKIVITTGGVNPESFNMKVGPYNKIEILQGAYILRQFAHILETHSMKENENE